MGKEILEQKSKENYNPYYIKKIGMKEIGKHTRLGFIVDTNFKIIIGPKWHEDLVWDSGRDKYDFEFAGSIYMNQKEIIFFSGSHFDRNSEMTTKQRIQIIQAIKKEFPELRNFKVYKNIFSLR